MLNVLSAFVPAEERIIVLEDTRELSLQREHVVRFETRPPDDRGRGAIDVAELFRASLRMRPDRIVLGEIRGAEAMDLIQAMTSGHGGCLTTVHATFPLDALNRLGTMALMAGLELPSSLVRAELAAAIDVIVQTARFRDGRRRVTHVTEVSGVDAAGAFQTRDLFRLERREGQSGVQLALLPTGVLPACEDILRDHGLSLPEGVRAAARRAAERAS